MPTLVNKLCALIVAHNRKCGWYNDRNGLWLQVRASGSKSWVFRQLVPLGVALMMGSPLVSAQVSVYSEQGKLFRAADAVTTLGSNLFGDKVNLYTGGLEFVQTDVSLPGNNALPVSVGRRLRTGTSAVESALFGRWDLDIPHLHGTFSQLRKWSSSTGTSAGARCSSFSKPPTVSGSSGSPSTWAGTEYWNGSFLYVPGIGDQELLKRSAAYTAHCERPPCNTGGHSLQQWDQATSAVATGSWRQSQSLSIFALSTSRASISAWRHQASRNRLVGRAPSYGAAA